MRINVNLDAQHRKNLYEKYLYTTWSLYISVTPRNSYPGRSPFQGYNLALTRFNAVSSLTIAKRSTPIPKSSVPDPADLYSIGLTDPDPYYIIAKTVRNFKKVLKNWYWYEKEKEINDLLPFIHHMFLKGHKNGHVGSRSGSIINWPPGSVRNI